MNVGRTDHFKDLTGQVFGRLRVLARIPHKVVGVKTQWYCVCECGNFKTTFSNYLRSGNTMSCGCSRVGQVRKHGASRSRAHLAWMHMKARCFNAKLREYPNYGGRGITVCERWLGKMGSANFIADMGQPPEGHTLDRIDVNGNYEPGNCRWATYTQQAQNKRNNRRVDDGRLLRDVAKDHGTTYDRVRQRVDLYGWDLEDALTTPSLGSGHRLPTREPRGERITINGETRTLRQWCEHYGQSYRRILQRWKHYGWDIEEALRTPPRLPGQNRNAKRPTG